MSRFKKAVREKKKLRLALDGPAGAGKTYTALRFAAAIGKRIALIDTEHGSASLYAGEAPDGIPFEFDTIELKTHSPAKYTDLIHEAEREGYDVIIIDSWSHAWSGAGGALAMVDSAKTKNKFAAWGDVTPVHNEMVEAILGSPCHVIATLRTHMEYLVEKDDQGRVTNITKVGLKPVQRNGVEYEFTVVGDMDIRHQITVSKTRCKLVDGAIESRPGAKFILPVVEWLDSGAEPEKATATATATVVKRVPVDEDQVRLFEHLVTGWDENRIAAGLQRYGAKRFEDLDHETADVILEKISAQLNGKKV